VFTGVADGSGAVQWEGRNSGGETVASGVYMALIETEGGRVKKKVIVQR